MSLSLSIKGAPWLRRRFVRDVVAALGVDSIRFVGGAVRDSLAGRTVKDIDAATIHAPETTIRLLKTAGIKVVLTGLKHGTVTAVGRDAQIEITTLRHDVQTDGRHADVAFTNDWRADAERRDFTMNALYANADGKVYDPFDGAHDLALGHVRFIGEPEARIREDVLRILRFFRFHAWYGKGAPDAAGLKACADLAGLIGTLSAERVRDEMLKLMAAPDPVPTLRAMLSAGIVAHLPGQPSDLAALGRIVGAETRLGLTPDPLLRLAAAAALEEKDVKALAKALRLSGKEAVHLLAVATGFGAETLAGYPALRVFLYRHGRVAARARLLCQGADAGLVKLAADWPVPALPVRGQDLIDLGLPAGPGISRALARLEEAWIATDFQASREELLAQAAKSA